MQIVYRPDPLKFKSLKKDIDDYFLQHLEKEVGHSPEDLATKIAKGMDLQQSVERVSNWQVCLFNMIRYNALLTVLSMVEEYRV